MIPNAFCAKRKAKLLQGKHISEFIYLLQRSASFQRRCVTVMRRNKPGRFGSFHLPPVPSTTGVTNLTEHYLFRPIIRHLNPYLIQQLGNEDEEKLLPRTLYPILKGHELISTEEAVVQMQKIVDTIGTVSEKARADIIMGRSRPKGGLHEQLKSWTIHEVPDTLSLPITAVSANVDLTSLPYTAPEVATCIKSDVTKSVFFYGWQSGLTTITSNRAAVKTVEAVIHSANSNDGGPDFYVVSSARSLVGKEKRGNTNKAMKNHSLGLIDIASP